MSIEKLNDDAVTAFGDVAKKINEIIDVINSQEVQAPKV